MKSIGLTLATALLALSVGSPSNAAQPTHFLLGAFPGAGVTAEAFESEIGHNIAIMEHNQKFYEMPNSDISDDIAAGRVPMLTWTSSDGTGGQAHAEDIINGMYDAQLSLQARAIAQLGGTVLIRWQPDMTDTSQYSQFNTNVSPNQQGAAYISVWKHIHQIFLHKGATNAQWVWAPGSNSYRILNGVFACGLYFPGARFVDWMGLDSYNKSDKPMAYDADPNFLAFYALAPFLAPGKPLIHADTGATHTTDAQREWIATAQTSLKTEFPLVRGFVWFNQNNHHTKPGSSQQYLLQDAGLDAFKTMAADPYFQ